MKKRRIQKLLHLYKQCKKSNSSFFFLLVTNFIIKLIYNKNIYLHQKVSINNIKNLHCKNLLKIGIEYVGFSSKFDATILNLQGSLIIGDNYSIGRGCRIDIGKNGTVVIGNGGELNVNSTLVIMHHLQIGDNTIISWNCQIIDEDFHKIKNSRLSIQNNNKIIIGNHVWIGLGVLILKGSEIADGCIVAANSVVNKKFTIPNCLIAGNPARVIKENIEWV
jgi:acetyltransferase-like isoleucine patch superfamily enzyme